MIDLKSWDRCLGIFRFRKVFGRQRKVRFQCKSRADDAHGSRKLGIRDTRLGELGSIATFDAITSAGTSRRTIGRVIDFFLDAS